MQAFRSGESVTTLPSFVTARLDGSFDVLLTERLWVYLGRHSTNDNTVSLVDHLRVPAAVDWGGFEAH